MTIYTVQQLRNGVSTSGNGRHAIVLCRVSSHSHTTVRGDVVQRRYAFPVVVVADCSTTHAEDLRRDLVDAGAIDLDVFDGAPEWQYWRDRARGADVKHDGGTVVFKGGHRVPDVGRRIAPFIARCVTTAHRLASA